MHFPQYFFVLAIAVHYEAEKEHRCEFHAHEYPLHCIQEIIRVHDSTAAVIYQVIIINIIKWNQAMISKISRN